MTACSSMKVFSLVLTRRIAYGLSPYFNADAFELSYLRPLERKFGTLNELDCHSTRSARGAQNLDPTTISSTFDALGREDPRYMGGPTTLETPAMIHTAGHRCAEIAVVAPCIRYPGHGRLPVWTVTKEPDGKYGKSAHKGIS